VTSLGPAGTAAADGRHAERVATLFDSKAAGWPGKYAADGRLAGRLRQLASAVAAVAATRADLVDLGCGSGELARYLAAAGYRVTGADIAPRMLGQAAAADPGRAVRWVALDPAWRRLPFPPASQDAVVAASVLEYVPDPGLVLRECARILRPGGVMVCTVPDVAHPVRWLEWPLGLAARSRLGGPLRRLPGRAGQYHAYLLTSRQRRPARWWLAAAGQAGLVPVAVPPARAAVPIRARREPLRLLAFTRAVTGAGAVARGRAGGGQ
jgi:SAM-dependent methyltransferase